MQYALVLENDSKTCNETSSLLASLGYLITPVFSPKKALHAAHMIQFDLIITSQIAIPGDRRSLTGELARCSPSAALILLVDPEMAHVDAIANSDSVSAILYRPLRAQDVRAVLERSAGSTGVRPPPRLAQERRARAVD